MDNTIVFNLNISPTVSATLQSWFLTSFALWMLSRKLKGKDQWMTWIPGWRYYWLGCEVNRESEGRICGLLDFFSVILSVAEAVLEVLQMYQGRVLIAMSLVGLVGAIILLVYSLRLDIGLTRRFGIRFRFVLVWIFADWLAMLVLAVMKKYQPVEIDDDEWPSQTVSETAKVRISGEVDAGMTSRDIDVERVELLQ